MSEESATPDLVERVRRAFEAANRRDIDAVVSSFAEDAIFDGRALGDRFEGRAAIRSLRDLVTRLTILDVDEARADAERLAEELA